MDPHRVPEEVQEFLWTREKPRSRRGSSLLDPCREQKWFVQRGQKFGQSKGMKKNDNILRVLSRVRVQLSLRYKGSVRMCKSIARRSAAGLMYG